LDDWRTEPPIEMYDPAIPVGSGLSAELTYHFFNDLDMPVIWPTEMCVLEGMPYPLLRGIDGVDGNLRP
jgi:hypothetical protein